MRFEIAESLNGDKIVYIARDPSGIVRIRENSMEELVEAIKKYQPNSKTPPVKKTDEEDIDKAIEELESSAPEEEVLAVDSENPPSDAKELASLLVTKVEKEKEPAPKKEFLQNDLKEKVEEKKKRTNKASFWDKLK